MYVGTKHYISKINYREQLEYNQYKNDSTDLTKLSGDINKIIFSVLKNNQFLRNGNESTESHNKTHLA